ncbi:MULTISPECIES: MFS transporter [unclassified Novosphingobium]|uniref:MFS transporter n=1 Tax=unclassified Novosphingobium TaxID=2644732 RepID=UPI00061BD0D7|nr:MULTISPECIES: MFS transporter [unclassified Novosphingobium]RQW42821.1 MFS transporter [Novosphingobium sp. LASN5T]GAO56906.1 major facilitator superfamily MFS_1 [Novosphingobium sp. MD-1]
MQAGSAFRAELREGWHELAAATFGLAFGVAGYTAISSLFFLSLRQEFGWSSSAAGVAFLVLPLTACILPLVGRLTDRFGVAAVAGLSAIAQLCAYLALAAQSGALSWYFVAFLVLNLLGSGTGPVTYTRLITRRFSRARGTALALAQFGIAGFAVILPPVVAAVIEGSGWRTAYLGLAGLTALGAAVAQILMRRDRTGGAQTRTGGEQADPRLVRQLTSEAIHSRPFWVLIAAVFALSAGSLGVVTQFQPILALRGLSMHQGGWLLSLLAGSVMASRIVTGLVLDRSAPALWAAAIVLIAAGGAAILAVAGTNVAVIAAGIVLFGASVGAELDLMSFFCARQFDLRAYSSIYGLLAMGFYIGMAAGAAAFGAIFDLFGRAEPALWSSVLCFIFAAGLFATLHRR